MVETLARIVVVLLLCQGFAQLLPLEEHTTILEVIVM